VRSEGDAAHHGPHRSEEHRPGKRKMEESGQIAPSPTEQEEAEAVQKNQPGKASAAIVGQGSRASAAAPRLRYPPFPRTCKLKDIRNWEKECNRIKKILEKGLLLNFAMPIFFISLLINRLRFCKSVSQFSY